MTSRAHYAANREAEMARDKRWREANREHANEYARIYISKHPQNRDARNRRLRAFWKRNPDANQVRLNRQRALKLGLHVEPVTVRDWQEMKVAFGGCCAYCLQPTARPAQEHMIPRSRGGAHALWNIVPACARCNTRKKNRTPLEFLVAELCRTR